MKRIAVALRLWCALAVLTSATVLTAAAQENEVGMEATDAVAEGAGGVGELEAEADEDLKQFLAIPDNKTLKLQATVQVECALLRRACVLTADQEKTLQGLDARWVGKILDRPLNQANPVAQPGLIMRIFGVNAAAAPRADPKVTLERALKKEIDQLLTDEQKLRYEAETRSRDEFRAAATASAITETFYERLGLTDQQAEKIQESIQPWVAKTNIQMLVYFSNPQNYPDVPEHLLLPHLSSEQLNAYRGLTRHLFTDVNFNDGQVPIVIER